MKPYSSITALSVSISQPEQKISQDPSNPTSSNRVVTSKSLRSRPYLSDSKTGFHSKYSQLPTPPPNSKNIQPSNNNPVKRHKITSNSRGALGDAGESAMRTKISSTTQYTRSVYSFDLSPLRRGKDVDFRAQFGYWREMTYPF